MIKPTMMILVLALAVGCSSKPNSDAEQAEAAEPTAQQPTTERQVRQRSEPAPVAREAARPEATTGVNPATQLPRLRGELSSDGFGLDMPIDGSSPESFLQSLELIAAESSQEQYQRFEQALVYLRRSEAAYSDLQIMYSSLDGLTPTEVIERFERHLRERVRR